MREDMHTIVREAVIELIHSTATEAYIRNSFAVHDAKVHFVPAPYRVIGGILQSLNIKFGNFIERLLALVVDNDPEVQALPASGTKVPF